MNVYRVQVKRLVPETATITVVADSAAAAKEQAATLDKGIIGNDGWTIHEEDISTPEAVSAYAIDPIRSRMVIEIEGGLVNATHLSPDNSGEWVAVLDHDLHAVGYPNRTFVGWLHLPQYGGYFPLFAGDEEPHIFSFDPGFIYDPDSDMLDNGVYNLRGMFVEDWKPVCPHHSRFNATAYCPDCQRMIVTAINAGADIIPALEPNAFVEIDSGATVVNLGGRMTR